MVFLEKDALGAHIHKEEIKKVTEIGYLEKEERNICMGQGFVFQNKGFSNEIGICLYEFFFLKGIHDELNIIK